MCLIHHCGSCSHWLLWFDEVCIELCCISPVSLTAAWPRSCLLPPVHPGHSHARTVSLVVAACSLRRPGAAKIGPSPPRGLRPQRCLEPSGERRLPVPPTPALGRLGSEDKLLHQLHKELDFSIKTSRRSHQLTGGQKQRAALAVGTLTWGTFLKF